MVSWHQYKKPPTLRNIKYFQNSNCQVQPGLDPPAMTALIFILYAILISPLTTAIVNPNQQTANDVIYLRKPNEIGPSSWQAGIQCLDTFTSIYFPNAEKLTRSSNMVLSSVINMSSPAAQIQDGFLKLVNEAVSERIATRQVFQLRVISDAQVYLGHRKKGGILLLADCYVLVIDDVGRFINLMRYYVSHMRSWNPGAKFLVLYNNIDKREEERLIVEAIFTEMQDVHYVNRVAVLFGTNMTIYNFWTMDYFSDEDCRKVRLRLIGECRDGLAYPDVGTVNASMSKYFGSINLKNCTLNMCASIAAPFIEEDCIQGIEMRIISFLRNRLDFQLNTSCQQENRGVLDDNGTWTGLLAKLNERDCDFILGGFYPDDEVLESFWTTDCYLADSFTWFVKLADPRPPWKALYSIFEDVTWLCFIAIILVSWFFWYFFVNMLPEPLRHKEISLACINAISVTIGHAVAERPLYTASRIFFMALTLYGLNTVAIYTSNLISVFTNPGYLHQIDEIEEAVEAKIPFGGHEESRDWFENDDDMWIYERYNYSKYFEPDTENLLAVANGQRVILSSRMFILQHNISDRVFAFPDNVFSSPLQMIMKPGFPFLLDFNWKIRSMRDYGIFTKIDNDFRFNNTVLNRIAKLRPNFKDSAIVLTTDHLQGPFAILIVGSTGSTVFFIGEILIFWYFTPYAKRRFNWKSSAEQTQKQLKKAQKMKSKSTSLRRIKNRTEKSHDKQKQRRKLSKLRHYQDNNLNMNMMTHNVNLNQGIRFTPIKRRIVYSFYD